MNGTGFLTVAFLRIYFQGPTSHWGIQCVDFDRVVGIHVDVSFNQSYPLPKLVCHSAKRRCYAIDGAHAIVSDEIVVSSVRVPLRRWPSVDRIPGDGQWPFCFSGGGAKYGGANTTATCGPDSDCLDVCFSDEDNTSRDVVWCRNGTVQTSVTWDDRTREEGWQPWRNGQPREESIDVVEIDSPVVVNRATGVHVVARHGTQWTVPRNDGVCLTPVQWTDSSCHVMVHGICYAYDHETSVRCVDLLPFPPAATVALTWQPRLVKTIIQPLEPATTDLFCLESSAHDPLRFLTCIKKLYPLARQGLSSLSPFVMVGRRSTVFVRVAPSVRTGGGHGFVVAQWGSIILSIGLGFAVWAIVAVTGTRITSHKHLLEHLVARVARELDVNY